MRNQYDIDARPRLLLQEYLSIMAVMFEGCDFPCCFLDRVVVPSVISVGIAGNLFILAVLRRDKICQRFQGFMHACMR